MLEQGSSYVARNRTLSQKGLMKSLSISQLVKTQQNSTHQNAHHSQLPNSTTPTKKINFSQEEQTKNLGQKQALLRSQEQLSLQKKDYDFQRTRTVLRESSRAYVKSVERPEDALKQKQRERQVKIPDLNNEQDSSSQLKEDYTYVMAFLANEIDVMKGEVEQTGQIEEIKQIFPFQEAIQIYWENYHPGIMCSLLKDYVRYFIQLNQALKKVKLQKKDDQHVMEHAMLLEKLQFKKREHEYLFTIEQLCKQKDALSKRLEFIEKHFTEEIELFCNDNEGLINLIKDKDLIMTKIQDQIEIKNEYIRSQDEKLLSVLIYEFKLGKIDIKYQAQVLKVMKHHTTDLEKYHSLLESCWKVINKTSQQKAEEQLNSVRTYISGIKNDLGVQISDMQNKYENMANSFNDKKKSFSHLNEIQNKISDIQMLSSNDKKEKSQFGKVRLAQQIQNNNLIFTNNQNASKGGDKSPIKDTKPFSSLTKNRPVFRKEISPSEHYQPVLRFKTEESSNHQKESIADNFASIQDLPPSSPLSDSRFQNKSFFNSNVNRPITATAKAPYLFSSNPSVQCNQLLREKMLTSQDLIKMKNKKNLNTSKQNNSGMTGASSQNTFNSSQFHQSLMQNTSNNSINFNMKSTIII